MVLFPQSYDSLLPPVKFEGDDANNQSLAVIMGTFTVLDLIQLDDVESTFDIYFKLDVHWYDVNLKYQFLHDLNAKNAFGSEAYTRMWKPSIQFFHIAKNDDVIDLGETIFVQKGTGSVGLSGGLDTLHVHEVYAGTENPIFLKFRKKMKFFCPFENIKNYPFGKEKCSLHFYIRGIANRLTEGRVQRYLLCNLVDFSIKWWVGSLESIMLIEAIFSIQFFQSLYFLILQFCGLGGWVGSNLN